MKLELPISIAEKKAVSDALRSLLENGGNVVD
jgi:hypothetical protein